MTSISSSFNIVRGHNSNNNNNAPISNNQKQYTKEELESLRREGEHLLRVGGEQVARERSNTSPLIYPGDSDDDDDFSYSNSKKNKNSDSDDSEEYNNNHGNSRNSLGKRSLQYTSMDSSNDNSNIVVIGPTLPPPIRSYSGNSTSSSSSKSSSKKRNKNKNEKRHRSTSDLSNNDDHLVSSSSSSEDEEDDAGISLNPEGTGNIVDVNFDFVDFNESCFHMTRQLISNSAWASFGVSEITNAVIDQVAVGTVIKVDEAITGFITALNINNKNIKQSSKEMQKFLLRTCPNAQKMNQILSNNRQNVGVLISERLVNLPSELSPAMHRSFLDDIEWASGNTSGLNDSLRKELSFDYLIVFSTVYITGGNSNSSSGSKKKKKKKKKRSKKKQKISNDGSGTNEQIYYVKFEDEILRDSATLSYTCPLRTSGIDTEPRSMGPFGIESCLVMVLEIGKLKGCVERLSLLVQQQQ